MPLLAKLKKAFIPPDPKAAFAAPPGVHRTTAWLDVAIGDTEAGRIELELFDDITPKTAENFRELCTGNHTFDGHPAGYKGSTFHRVVPGFMIQGGDFVRGDGTGMYSIYNGAFPDENFTVKHTIPGLLSMANSGPGTNGCQFFITTAPADFLDGVHVCFGRVVGGMPVVKAIEGTPTGAADRPIQTVRIVSCGVNSRAGVQDELATTEGGAAGVDPASTATGTSAAPAAHNFEGTGAPVDHSGAPLNDAEREGQGHHGGIPAAGGAGAAGAAGLAAHHNQQHQQNQQFNQHGAGGAGVGTGLGTGTGGGETYHDALDTHQPLHSTTTRSTVVGGPGPGPSPGYGDGSALDSMRSRHDPLDPRSGTGYGGGSDLGSALSTTSTTGYAGGAGVSPTTSKKPPEKRRASAFASAAVDFAAPNLRDNVQGDVNARSPESSAPIHQAHHGGGGWKGAASGLYRRFSKSDEKEKGKVPASPTSPSARQPALGSAGVDYAGTHPVDHRREGVDGQLETTPAIHRAGGA